MGRAAGNRDPWWGADRVHATAQLSDPDPSAPEPPIPADPVVVAEEAGLLVVDKPPFLPATPNGRIQHRTVQQRLRESRGEPDLVCLHRLDRLTSGLVLVSRDPTTRGAYQQLFQRGEVRKCYAALTVAPDDWVVGETREVRVAIANVPGERGVRVLDDVPADAAAARPAVTTVTYEGLVAADVGDCLGHAATCSCGACGSVMQVAKWRLEPKTGRTHQLRATMHHLGYPILGDDTYPDDLGLDLADTTLLLRLVATELAYVDPLDGRARHWVSERRVEDPRQPGWWG